MADSIPHLTPRHAECLNGGLLEAMPGGVVHVRADGSIASANSAALSLLGISYDKLTDRYVSDFEPETFHEDGSPFRTEDYPVSRALATGEPQSGVTIGVRRPDGGLTWAVFRATPVRGASGKVEGAIVTFLDISDRKRAEREAAKNQELLGRAQSLAQVGCYEWQLETNRMVFTEGLFQIYGIGPAEFGGDLDSALAPIHPDDRALVTERAQIAAEEGVAMSTEYRVVRSDGSIRFVWAVGEVIHGDDGAPIKVVGAIQDITERKELEGRLHQLQRMESVGQLAGGIAHDFNNLLQVIVGNAAIGIEDRPPATELVQIRKAAERASELTRQLLAFGRRQEFKPQIVDVNVAVRDLERMLVRTLAGEAELEVVSKVGAASINADRNQLEQVLMNLCLNARDAMEGCGTITITTARIRADAAFRAKRPWARMDHYLEIAVADTGSGMEEAVKSKIFEPFYTTKPVGSGSGLGLAAVHGIVQQHEGMVEVESEVGVGSTFRVYLPEVTPGRATATPQSDPVPTTGNETILIVDDEEMVRDLAARTLQRGNYRVLVADCGQEALAILKRSRADVSLLLTDIVMPGMDGHQLATEARRIDPTIATLFTTGYATNKVQEGIEEGDLLRKPYAPRDLLMRIRRALDGAKASALPPRHG